MKGNNRDKIVAEVMGAIITVGSFFTFMYVVATDGDPMHSVVAFAFAGIGSALYYGSEKLLENAMSRNI